MSKQLRNLDKFLEDPTVDITRSSAIRLKCLDCTGNQQAEVTKCPAYMCPLWPYRSGGHRQELSTVTLSEREAVGSEYPSERGTA